MLRVLAAAQKLRGRSLDELRVRGMQTLHAHAESLGLSARAREPDDVALRRMLDPARLPLERLDGNGLKQHFQERGARQFFPGVADRPAMAAQLAARWPDDARDAIASADRIVAGHLDVFGREIFVGERPDWMLDPRSRIRAPARHWSRIAFLDPGVAGDCKHTWEISRHQYFVTLGRAYWLTRDERYARVFATQLTSFMDDNPPKIGINWASSLEVSLRTISWLWAIHLFRDSAALDDRLIVRMLKYLYVHGRHLETYLSTYFSPNTHLTGEALGLLYLGVAVPEFKRSARWRELGARVLEEQLERQLLGDGVYFEQSTYYHRYTTDIYLHAWMLAAANQLELAAAVRPKLLLLSDYLVHMTRPDGTSPLIGDDDGGRLAVLGRRPPNDFRDTVALAAVALERGDLAFVAGKAPAEVLWLLGPAGVRTFDALAKRLPDNASIAFTESGYFIMRDGWTASADHAVVRCGPHGALTGAHAHADALALELTVAGRSMLVDPGTYTYSASAPERDKLRGSAVHNTVTVDDESSSAPGRSPFTWGSVARAALRAWVAHPLFDFFEGEHDGYARLESPAIHTRSLLYVKGGYWVMRDRVHSAGAHRVALRFQWAPGVDVHVESDRGLLASVTGDAVSTELRVRVFTDAGCFSRAAGWVSPSYGSRTEAGSCVFRRDGTGTQELVTVLAPARRAFVERSTWRSVGGGAVLTLPIPGGIDTIVIGAEREGLEADGIATTGGWIWVRRSPRGEATQFIGVGVSALRIDGEDLLHDDTPRAFVVGRHSSDGWRLEMPATLPATTDARRTRLACAASAE